MPGENVFVVDDDMETRDGLKFALRSAGYNVEIFASARAFLAAYDPGREGCLVVDWQMPTMNGTELQQEFNRRGWRIPVIFFTGEATISVAIEAIKAGAFDLIEKPAQEKVLLDRVRRALASTHAPSADRLLRAQLETHVASLTARERAVLELVATGEPCKVIARHLGISFRTVEAHRANIIRKLGARGPSDLVRLASIFKYLPPA
jgi:two-component system response regulator FixJ